MRTQIFMLYRVVNLVLADRGTFSSGRHRFSPFAFSYFFIFLFYFLMFRYFLLYYQISFFFHSVLSYYLFFFSEFPDSSFSYFFLVFLRIFSLCCCFSRRLLFSDSKAQDYKDLASENKLLESSY